MNPCCEHLFREAKREIEIRDKRIIELQSECTRLFEPTREFWNMENQTRIENLIKENELYTDKIFELEDKSSVLTVELEGYKAEFEKYLKAYHIEIETNRKLQAENERLQNYVITGYEQGVDELTKELNICNQILWEIVDAWYYEIAFGQKMYHIKTIITDKHYSYLRKFIGRKNER
jgi:hypothetical protein